MVSIQEDGGHVFINSFFGVSSEGNIFDDDFVVDVDTFGEQYFVGSEDVVNTRFFTGFFGFELGFRRKVATVIVS